MPVSLDKTPGPRPEDMDRAPAYRPQLSKLTALFLVIADDQGQWASDNTTPRTREVLAVERAATNDVERAMRKADITEECQASGLTLVEVYADSAAQAAVLACRAHADALVIEAVENAVLGQLDA
ncbi:hypothetical protein [Streptomyces sp. NBC_01320]|uniref:hypothetical protein n=1 Tax=Streptomyces sp. NBC_01320 TaxID=2903824 RepID=UPI002E128862|nr:hypothetical protein OG395_57020 [Streptomyces sp. NBC_01320]